MHEPMRLQGAEHFPYTTALYVNNSEKTFSIKQFSIQDTAAYQLGNTSSRTNTEVKQCWLGLYLDGRLFKCCLSVAAKL